MSMSPPQPGPSLDWDDHVAREAEHQELIEAAFDRADAFERLGDPAEALAWLDRADEMSGGLSPQYEAKRARFARELAGRDRSRERV
jgi:hypothetical protein